MSNKANHRIAETSSDAPGPIDLFIGTRIRMRRISLELAEADLAAMIGAAPDVVSAIEMGQERVGAARLVQLAQILAVPMSWFVDGLGPIGQFEFGGRLPSASSVTQELSDSEARSLLLAHFDAIRDADSRRLILDLARKLADREINALPRRRDNH